MLRAEIMAGCQESVKNCLFGETAGVPVDEQGELFSAPLRHFKPNIPTAGLRASFKTCQLCQHQGSGIKQNNTDVPGDQIRLTVNDPSLLLFFHDWDIHPTVRGFFILARYVFSLKTDRGSKQGNDMARKTKWIQTE